MPPPAPAPLNGFPKTELSLIVQLLIVPPPSIPPPVPGLLFWPPPAELFLIVQFVIVPPPSIPPPDRAAWFPAIVLLIMVPPPAIPPPLPLTSKSPIAELSLIVLLMIVSV